MKISTPRTTNIVNADIAVAAAIAYSKLNLTGLIVNADIAAAAAIAGSKLALGGYIGEGHITILPFMYSAGSQGTWALVADAAHWSGFDFNNTTFADLDNRSYSVYLAQGTYVLSLFTTTAANRGILDFDIDAVEVASVDCYTAGTVYNTVKDTAGIVVATPGLKTLRARIHGKNGASSGFHMTIDALVLWRSA